MDGPVLGAVSRDFLKRRDRRGGGRAADGAAGGEREATRDDRSGPASRSLTLSRSQRASEGRLSHVWCERGNAFIPQIRDFPTAVANVLLYLPILKDIVGLFGVMDASAATIRTRGRPLSSLFPPFSLLVQFFKAFSLFQSFSSRFSRFSPFSNLTQARDCAPGRALSTSAACSNSSSRHIPRSSRAEERETRGPWVAKRLVFFFSRLGFRPKGRRRRSRISTKARERLVQHVLWRVCF